MTTANREDFLETMADRSRERVAALAGGRLALRARAASRAPAPPLRLDAFDLIAEIKPTSPAEGTLAAAESLDVADRVRAYAEAGAAAISVLTEDTRFGGSLALLERAVAAADACDVPVLRKDFLVDPVQVVEARACGAGGVLLIARMLDDGTLAAMLGTARDLGLFTLLEAFDAGDLERITRTLAREPHGELLVGVNSRDLSTLRVDRERLFDLATALPRGVPAVAESGILTPADAERAGRAGYALALVGTALMRADDPRELGGALLAAGRTARASAPQEARP